MHRIDGPGAINELFTEGNPAIGQRATKITQDWLNDVQQNICFVIEDAGLELEKGTETQLKDALVALIAGVVGDGEGAVPTTLTVVGGGLVSGGGDLTVNRTLTVAKASAAEVAAGIRDDVAVTPLGLAGGAGGKLFEATGYIKQFNGLILMWATATANGNGYTNVTLPTTFPAQCVFATFAGAALNTGAQDNNPDVVGKSASTVTLFSAVDGSVTGAVFALGF